MKSCLKCGSTDIISGVVDGIFFHKCRVCAQISPLTVDFPDESLKKMKADETGKKLEKRMRKLEGWGRL